MKFNMANFFPMLSSSPPPIDDADSPENEDDEFGIFTSANSAFDCSFDNDIFDEGSATGSNFSKAKVIENNASVASSIASVEETTTKIHPQNFNKTDLCEDIENVECKNTDSKDTVLANSCKLGIHKNSECMNTLEHCEPLEGSLDDRQKNSVKSDTPAGDSSHASLCNNGPASIHSVTGDSNCTGLNNEEEIAIKSEPTGMLKPDDDVNVLSSAEVLSEHDSVHMCSAKTVECEGEGKICDDDDDLEYHASVPNDCSQYSSSFDDSLPRADNPSECIVNGTSGTLSSDYAKVDHHTVASNSSDIPDLTFIPFSPEEIDEDVEEFDEFLDSGFSYTVEQQENQCSNGIEVDHSNKSISPVESEDDEFGDFESGKPVIKNEVQNVETEEENEFADFESSEIHNNKCAAEFTSVPETESEEFADFEAANLELPTAAPKEPDKENKLSTVISAVFPVSEELATSISNESIHDVLEQNCKSRRLWERLHDIDETPGLPFQWSVSHSFQQMLRSINVDYHSILRTSTVPFFASGLGLLEPTKGTAAAAESKKTDTDTPNTKEPIPPVHFDWGSSGLINPLDSGQSISTIMDLSFLNSSTTASSGETGRDFSLENELLMTSLEPNPSDICPRAPILEQLLSLGAKSSLAESHPSSRPPSLSQEAVHVLDQLPDISFMRAQVLMFPLSNST